MNGQGGWRIGDLSPRFEFGSIWTNNRTSEESTSTHFDHVAGLKAREKAENDLELVTGNDLERGD